MTLRGRFCLHDCLKVGLLGTELDFISYQYNDHAVASIVLDFFPFGKVVCLLLSTVLMVVSMHAIVVV